MYGLNQDVEKANAFFEQYKDKVRNTIRNRKKWWLVKKINYTYLKKEDPIARKFFKACLDDENYLRKLLVGSPNELLEFIKEFLKQGDEMRFFKEQLARIRLEDKDIAVMKEAQNIGVDKKELSTIEDEEVKDILNKKGTNDFNYAIGRVFVDELYNAFLDKRDFVKSKNLRICPYCGRNYIFSVDRENGRVIKPQIDHFLPKGKFPFLAFSYYNMIPCCTTCNVDAKGTVLPLSAAYDKYTIPHPYVYNDTWKFRFKLKDTDLFSEFANGRAESIEVDYEGNPEDKEVLDVHNDLFGIRELYKEHNDLVHELLIRKQFWTSETARGFYRNILNSNVSSKVIMALLGYTDNTSEYGKHPFEKFLKEISDYYDKVVKMGKK